MRALNAGELNAKSSIGHLKSGDFKLALAKSPVGKYLGLSVKEHAITDKTYNQLKSEYKKYYNKKIKQSPDEEKSHLMRSSVKKASLLPGGPNSDSILKGDKSKFSELTEAEGKEVLENTKNSIGFLYRSNGENIPLTKESRSEINVKYKELKEKYKELDALQPGAYPQEGVKKRHLNNFKGVTEDNADLTLKKLDEAIEDIKNDIKLRMEIRDKFK